MRNENEFAIFLVSSWKLTEDSERIPASAGILDAAIESSLDSLPTV
jgi:hypothetical protein